MIRLWKERTLKYQYLSGTFNHSSHHTTTDVFISQLRDNNMNISLEGLPLSHVTAVASITYKGLWHTYQGEFSNVSDAYKDNLHMPSSLETNCGCLMKLHHYQQVGLYQGTPCYYMPLHIDIRIWIFGEACQYSGLALSLSALHGSEIQRTHHAMSLCHSHTTVNHLHCRGS